MVSNLRWLLLICFALLACGMGLMWSSSVGGAAMTGTVMVVGAFAGLAIVIRRMAVNAEAAIASAHETNVLLARDLAASREESDNKSQFLANTSHELRTPLNAIIGFSEFIRSECSGPIGNKMYAEYIQDIFNSGVHLLSLINDILDYSKAAADKLDLDMEPVDARNTVLNSVRLVSQRARDAQVQVIQKLPEGDFELKTDARRLKQILLNLLSNAIKFTPAGGSVTVTLWQNLKDSSLCIEVRDTGIGIAPKDIPRALSPFSQIDNALSRKHEGTGLGLPLSKKFVELLGGSFGIESEVGKGTAITITLPKETAREAAPAMAV